MGDLTFNLHIDKIISKAYQKLGALCRKMSLFRDVRTLLILFSTLIRPSLEYNSIIWDPGVHYLIDRIEGVQRKFLRRLKSFFPEEIFLKSLADRRKIAGQKLLYQVFHNNIDCPELLSCFWMTVPHNSLRNFRPLHVPILRFNYQFDHWLYRICSHHNLVSSNIDIDLFSVSPAEFLKILNNYF